jgi:hypothetical protein
MRLFLDSEFSDLIPGNKLISIALVDENEEYFYAELTDTYKLEDCSEFVKQHVLPFLRGGDYKMTSIECSLKIGNWIESRGPKCMLACDNMDWDIPHLRKLLKPIWPANLEQHQIFTFYVPSEVEAEIVAKYDYHIHNALDDALIMKKAIIR